MTTQTKQPQDQAQVQPTITLTDVKNVGLGTIISTLNAVNNTARVLEHTTGILADKAERYREQVGIQDAITHNDLMAEYKDKAKKHGLTFD